MRSANAYQEYSLNPKLELSLATTAQWFFENGFQRTPAPVVSCTFDRRASFATFHRHKDPSIPLTQMVSLSCGDTLIDVIALEFSEIIFSNTNVEALKT
jgi:hypothetical protein